MSGITTVKVKIGQYSCYSCLQESLERLNLKNKIQIIQEGGVFHILLQEQIEDTLKQSAETKLKIEIERYHNRILPIYTEFHAIHSLKDKGFKHIKTYEQNQGYKLIFEKVAGSGVNERIERYEITVLPNENRILIDGGDMPGDYCRQYAYKFQKSLGVFEGFIPHKLSQNQTEKEKIKTSQKIGLKRI